MTHDWCQQLHIYTFLHPSTYIYRPTIRSWQSVQVLEQHTAASQLARKQYISWCVYMSILMDEMDLTIRRLCRSLQRMPMHIYAFLGTKNTWKKVASGQRPRRQAGSQFRQLLALYMLILDKHAQLASFFVAPTVIARHDACKRLKHQADSSRQGRAILVHTIPVSQP